MKNYALEEEELVEILGCIMINYTSEETEFDLQRP